MSQNTPQTVLLIESSPREEKWSTLKNDMVSNYITSTQWIETKVWFFFAWLLLLTKPWKLHRGSRGLHWDLLFPGSQPASLSSFPVNYKATFYVDSQYLLPSLLPQKPHKHQVWSSSQHNKTSLELYSFTCCSTFSPPIGKYDKYDIRWDEIDSVTDAIPLPSSWLYKALLSI